MKAREPIVNDIKSITETSLALNWYRVEKTKKDCIQYLTDYCRHHELDYNTSNIKDSDLIATYGWLSRILMNNNIQCNESHTRIINYLEEACRYVSEDDEVKVRKYVKAEYDIDAFISELEAMLDMYFINSTEFSVSKEVQKGSVPSKFRKDILEWCKKNVKEFTIDDDDEEKLEAYSNLTTRQRNKLISIFNDFIDLKRNSPKPKNKRKNIDPNKRTSKVKYKEYDLVLDVKSVHPVHLFGAKIAVIYNTVSGFISVYKSLTADGFDVKGSAIKEFSPNIGKKKVNSESAKTFLTCDANEIITNLDNLKTKSYTNNGSINEQCIILRVEK